MSSDGVGGSVESETGERGPTRDASDAGRDAATTGADDDGGYVHRPDAAASPVDADAGGDVEAATAGVRGWVLVGVVVTCFLVIPGVIYLLPAVLGRLGLPFVVAMLALPMLPALLLGLTAGRRAPAAFRVALSLRVPVAGAAHRPHGGQTQQQCR